ncbi:MAG: sugar phosphate isomerase/epimerase [Clostridiales bacterium]|nr:sugar phosphate isomerase/epimerase [Clostridiales bacterium]
MNKNAYKVSASTAFFGRTVPDIVHFYAEAGIDAMEIAGMNPAHLEQYDLEGIKEECTKEGVELRSLHLPFGAEQNISHPDKALRMHSIDIDKQIMERAAKLGVILCVIHPSSEPIEDKDRSDYLSRSEESLHILCEFAGEVGLSLAAENLPRTCLCNTSEEMIRMLQKVPSLKTCFDLNHFLPWKGTKPDNAAHIYHLKQEVGDRLITLHISDYDFVDERHLFPFDGDNDWVKIMNALHDTGYQGYYNYEIGSRHGDKGGKTLHDLKANFEKLISLIQVH